MIKGCILPWIHMHGNITGQYKVCCVSRGAVTKEHTLGTHEESMLKVWNEKPYRDLRKQFLNDEIPTQCKRECYDKEKQGGHSQRQEMNGFWSNKEALQSNIYTNEDGSITVPPKYLDIRFGNICNFKCRMCGSFASSQWGKEDKILGRHIYPITDTWTDNNILWKDLKKLLPYLEEIYFAGGEPLVQDGHYKLLHFLIDNNKTDLTISYNTNLSVLTYKKENIFDLWKEFKSVNLFISQDGYKNVAEYIRKGLVWDTFSSNFKKVSIYADSISCVVQIYNIYNIPKLLVYCSKNKKNLYPNLLTNPDWLSIQILSNKEKEKIIKYYKLFMKQFPIKNWQAKKLINMLEFMKYTPSNIEIHQSDFKINTQLLDANRNENFCSIVPELEEWYKSIKVLA